MHNRSTGELLEFLAGTCDTAQLAASRVFAKRLSALNTQKIVPHQFSRLSLCVEANVF